MKKHSPEIVKLAATILKKAQASNWTAGGDGTQSMSYGCNDSMPRGTVSVDYCNYDPAGGEPKKPNVTVRSNDMSIDDSIKVLQEMAKIIPMELKRLQAVDAASKGTSESSTREVEDAAEKED